MYSADIPLNLVQAGMFLLLDHKLFMDPRRANQLFCEPQEVRAVHCTRMHDERSILRDGGTIIRAIGSHRPTNREIGLEMAGRFGGRVLVLFPDDRQVVRAVNLPDQSGLLGTEAKVAQSRADCTERTAIDPATGHVHNARDLSSYRLPAFWRDASIAWFTLPASWIGRTGWHTELLLLEALGGVRSPAPADLAASETLFHEDITIGTATLCWEEATVAQYQLDERMKVAVDPPPDPLLDSALQRLLAAYGSAEALRSTALAFVDANLNQTGADAAYLKLFMEERQALAIKVAKPHRPANQ